MQQRPFVKTIVTQLHKKFNAFYETLKFVTVFTKQRQLRGPV